MTSPTVASPPPAFDSPAPPSSAARTGAACRVPADACGEGGKQRTALVKGHNAQPLVTGHNAQPLVKGHNAQPLVKGHNAQPLVKGNTVKLLFLILDFPNLWLGGGGGGGMPGCPRKEASFVTLV